MEQTLGIIPLMIFFFEKTIRVVLLLAWRATPYFAVTSHGPFDHQIFQRKKKTLSQPLFALLIASFVLIALKTGVAFENFHGFGYAASLTVP